MKQTRGGEDTSSEDARSHQVSDPKTLTQVISAQPVSYNYKAALAIIILCPNSVAKHSVSPIQYN